MTTIESAQKKRAAELEITEILRQLEKDTQCTFESISVTTVEGLNMIPPIDSVHIKLLIR